MSLPYRDRERSPYAEKEKQYCARVRALFEVHLGERKDRSRAESSTRSPLTRRRWQTIGAQEAEADLWAGCREGWRRMYMRAYVHTYARAHKAGCPSGGRARPRPRLVENRGGKLSQNAAAAAVAACRHFRGELSSGIPECIGESATYARV